VGNDQAASRGAVEASAPTRVDLAGGTLELWPPHLVQPGALTVNVAIDRRVWARVEPIADGVVIESKDTPSRSEASDVTTLIRSPGAPLAAYVLAALGIERGVKVATRLRLSADSGLGPSSALALAVAAAAGAALSRTPAGEALVPLVRDAEVQASGVPTGLEAHMAALHGGPLAVHFEPGSVRVERLAADPGRIEESLLLVDSGKTRVPVPDTSDAAPGPIESRAGVREALETIGEGAASVRKALTEARFADVGELFAREWEARKCLGAEVTTPEIDRIVSLARAEGGAAKACGAGGGGIVAVWASPGARGKGCRERVEGALKEAGFRFLPFRLDLRGLEVSAPASPQKPL
jgi:D-glycero-alpha-D-manno-heptose-7-phosphate kinase